MILVPSRFVRPMPRGRVDTECSPLPRPRVPRASFLLLAVAMALALRLVSASGSLWLDEIWSLDLARQARSPVAILTELHADNNHPLNTLYLRLIGPVRPPWVYRLPAALAGTVLVLVGARTAARWGRVASVTAATLLASSYLLVHYSSEARGYAIALCAAYCGWETALRYSESHHRSTAAAFWLSGIVGLLAHPIFTHFLLAVSCWLVPVIAARSESWLVATRRLATVLLVPSLVAGSLAWFSWRQMDLGGGPPYSLWQIIQQTSSLAIGGPPAGWGATLGTVIAIAACTCGVRSLRTDRRQAGLFFISALLVPVIHALVVKPPFLFPRYFLMAAGFVPVLASFALARLYRVRPWGRWAYTGLVAAWIGMNLVHVTQLAKTGRGQYLAALEHLAQATPGSPITISSDHNFGVGRLVEFYGPQVSPRREFHYIDGNQWPSPGPQWLILHRGAESGEPPPLARYTIDGHDFEFERLFDSAMLSGWQWWCYRRRP